MPPFTITTLVSLTLLVGMASAAPRLRRRDTVECKQRYGGTLAITSGPTEAAHVITLGHTKTDPLTTDFIAANNPGPYDVAFYFSQCNTQAPGWTHDDDAIVGQLVVFTSGDKFVTPWTAEGGGGCVTVAPLSDNGQVRALTVEACASSTDDERLSRQWFSADELKLHPDLPIVTIRGQGAPGSGDGFAFVQQTDAGVVVPLATSGDSYFVMTDVADAQQ